MLVLITGCPASGKSSISCDLAKSINAIIIPQDAFFNGKFDFFPYDKDDNGAIEGSEIYDWKRLLFTVKRIYKVVNVIVEGHRILECEALVIMADHIFNLTIDKRECKRRFTARYAENYTTEQLELKETYFEKFTWPISKEYRDNVVMNLPQVVHVYGSIRNMDKILETIK
jgi:broad-specificity NMP kinase